MFNIDDIDIKLFPIIIYASPRTGCSVVGDVLSEKYPQLRYFNEPFAQNNNDFIQYATVNSLYIVKTMSYDVFEKNLFQQCPYKIVDDFQNKGFKIRVRRRNLVEQITSNYIAATRNMWIYNIYTLKEFGLEGQYRREILPIDLRKIRQSITAIKMRNQSIDNIPVKIDLDLWFEDLDGIDSETVVKTPQPANYNDIKKAIEENL